VSLTQERAAVLHDHLALRPAGGSSVPFGAVQTARPAVMNRAAPHRTDLF
jgi:hypothetical protein